jgi:hypothetical protein
VVQHFGTHMSEFPSVARSVAVIVGKFKCRSDGAREGSESRQNYKQRSPGSVALATSRLLAHMSA